MDRVRARLERLYGGGVTPRLMERLALLAGRYDKMWQSKGRAALWDQRDAVLITYGDMVRSPGERPLVTLRRFLDERLQGAIPAVHILPFFPYSSDDGFSVTDYRAVNPDLGRWEDVRELGRGHRLMFDLVLNHVSRGSGWFRDYVNGIAPARHYFISVDHGTDLSAVVRPRTTPLLSTAHTRRGVHHLWTTFSADQIDLRFTNPDVLFEFLDILFFYVSNGARIIRLDAIAYLWKEIGTPCIHLPQTHEVVKLLRDVLDMLAPGVILITETNVPHAENVSYFGDGDEAHMVYQFSLPPLLLHALHTGDTGYLQRWAASLPPPPAGCTFLNFTASHDGIGVRPLEGLVPHKELHALIEGVEEHGGSVSVRTRPDGSESPYELNITYFDALSDPGQPPSTRHIARFLCSQAVMLALRGVPAVYFHSLTATPNDTVGVEVTGRARSINRKRWDCGELSNLLDDPSTPTARVFRDYLRLLTLRAAHPAFHPDGPQRVLGLERGLFGVERTAPDDSETILAISNLSARSRRFTLDERLTGSSNVQVWEDLITGRSGTGAGKRTWGLAPYETVWLRAAPTGTDV